MAILNSNVIADKNKELGILSMGLSACQARCLSCSCCAVHRGK